MADKEKLRDMLDNLINQKPEQADIDFHDYLRGKMQDVTGIGTVVTNAGDGEESDKE